MPKFDHVRRGLCLLSATVAAPPAYARSGGAESVIIFVGTVIALGIAFWVIGSVIRSRVDERVRVEMQVRLHQITERERPHIKIVGDDVIGRRLGNRSFLARG